MPNPEETAEYYSELNPNIFSGARQIIRLLKSYVVEDEVATAHLIDQPVDNVIIDNPTIAVAYGVRDSEARV